MTILNNKYKAKPKSLSFHSRKLNENVYKKINDDLGKIDWDDICNYHLDDGFQKLTDVITMNLDKHAPKKLITIKAKNIIREPWITKGILASSRNLNKLYKRSKNADKKSFVYKKYKNYKKVYNKIKRNAKQDYYKNKFDEFSSDIKKTWSTLNKIIGRSNDKSSFPDSFKVNNSSINDTKTIANGFCEYFTNVGHNFASKIPAPNEGYEKHMKGNYLKSFFPAPTSPEEICRIIMSLKSKKSSGPDEINSILLKNIAKNISKPVSSLINKSLAEGHVPEILKIAKVVPIYKSKDKEQFSNYRPISLLPVISKVLEKIMHKRLYNFMCSQGSICNHQYGFRPKHSTSHAVTELVQYINNSFDNNENLIGVFLDLSKAFDTIDHNILLNKLNYYGVRGVALDWFKSYLSDRSQYVSFKSTNSDKFNLNCGVPQGSVLGPLLFIIYTNDLPNILKSSRVILFADDTTIFIKGKNKNILYKLIQKDLDLVTDWFKANKLSLNVSKTNLINFYKKSNAVNCENAQCLKMAGETISEVDCAKFLGIYIDKHLEWNEHINYVHSKLSHSNYIICTCKNYLNKRNLLTLYYSLFHHYLNYGIINWGNAKEMYLNGLRILQKKCVRNIHKAKYTAHTKPLYVKSNILNIDNMYKHQTVLLMYDYHTNNIPVPLKKLFTANSEVHNYNTRQACMPHKNSANTAKLLKSFIHKGPKLWAEVPRNIRNLVNKNSVKKNLKKYLQTKDD